MLLDSQDAVAAAGTAEPRASVETAAVDNEDSVDTVGTLDTIALLARETLERVFTGRTLPTL